MSAHQGFLAALDADPDEPGLAEALVVAVRGLDGDDRTDAEAILVDLVGTGVVAAARALEALEARVEVEALIRASFRTDPQVRLATASALCRLKPGAGGERAFVGLIQDRLVRSGLRTEALSELVDAARGEPGAQGLAEILELCDMAHRIPVVRRLFGLTLGLGAFDDPRYAWTRAWLLSDYRAVRDQGRRALWEGRLTPQGAVSDEARAMVIDVVEARRVSSDRVRQLAGEDKTYAEFVWIHQLEDRGHPGLVRALAALGSPVGRAVVEELRSYLPARWLEPMKAAAA